ncbi:DUF45 domain-containing protein [Metamycoplasma hyosynoviae]|uniref:YgjP-like metallopeptidase domain-containing protein n=1 Tax=Metamycoplasma hyosynoviae TaxID=29559 RepID=UPI002358E994|nr:YgjP-like metallopeptidase domain-containing protein [Metamycoplasma hyosynoviae]MDC8918225.1 DUF45 domain-containing protein [Metamycoplasma hyosynoviae]MDC8937699.1 DUF45 domain-containing protein [Metamycoplasma hyosynoviae]MDD1360542.1 DUF45 domain-containing protein [Metamycoplasma hyosynoviae]MDD1361881.1 DUF45 domain-containing protein [Metamycoplasma hyosynoviae]MDD7893650.1 DUF45 domain-containing protein [Metamycoplasma hyosynoviae]
MVLKEVIDNFLVEGKICPVKVIITDNKKTYFESKDGMYILKVNTFDFHKKEIENFVSRSITSFKFQKSKIKPSLEVNLIEKYFYLFGEKITYFVSNNKLSFSFEDELIAFNNIEEEDDIKIEKTLWNWMRQKLEEKLNFLILKHFFIICPKKKLDDLTIKIIKKKTAWGTNYVIENQIIFSQYLALFEPYIIEYVVVHELVHFNFPNHSKEFWASVKNILPDYKKRKSNLNNHIFKYN